MLLIELSLFSLDNVSAIRFHHNSYFWLHSKIMPTFKQNNHAQCFSCYKSHSFVVPKKVLSTCKCALASYVYTYLFIAYGGSFV